MTNRQVNATGIYDVKKVSANSALLCRCSHSVMSVLPFCSYILRSRQYDGRC